MGWKLGSFYSGGKKLQGWLCSELGPREHPAGGTEWPQICVSPELVPNSMSVFHGTVPTNSLE